MPTKRLAILICLISILVAISGCIAPGSVGAPPVIRISDDAHDPDESRQQPEIEPSEEPPLDVPELVVEEPQPDEPEPALIVSMPETPPEQSSPTQIHRPALVENVDYIIINGERYSTSLDSLCFIGLGLSDEDIEPLQYMKKLDYLFLCGNEVSDLTPLAELTRLTCLRLDNNQISDLSPLSGLAKLEYLFLENNQISDLAPLSGLVKLEYLTLDNNQIGDFTPLQKLPLLKEVGVTGNMQSAVSLMPDFILIRDVFHSTALESLHVDSTWLSNEELLSLQYMTNLESLDISEY